MLGWEIFWLPLITAGIIAATVTAGVVKYAKILKIVDNPKEHKLPKVVHTYPVPRGGGIPIFVALTLTSIIFLPINQRLVGILIGAGLLFGVGWLDDRYSEKISPYWRLVVNVLAATAVIGAGIGIAYLNNPLGGIIHLNQPQSCWWLWGETRCVWWLADIFALVWLVWMQNIIGWSSGVDGQLPGFVIIAAIAIGALAMRFADDPNQWSVITLAAIVAGAYGGFLPFNIYPQKIMTGYGGKSLAGFLLGILAILSVAKVGTLLMVLAVPFVDAVLVIIKRIREGRSPVWGGTEHLHHQLMRLGWGKRRIALFYWLISGLMAVVALRLQAGVKYFTMAAGIAIITGAILWLQYWSTWSKQPDRDSG